MKYKHYLPAVAPGIIELVRDFVKEYPKKMEVMVNDNSRNIYFGVDDKRLNEFVWNEIVKLSKQQRALEELLIKA